MLDIPFNEKIVKMSRVLTKTYSDIQFTLPFHGIFSQCLCNNLTFNPAAQDNCDKEYLQVEDSPGSVL
jgi:hypothetical protein